MARNSHVSHTEYTILVVDDQEEVRTSVRRLLEREGHTALTVDSGEQALVVLKQAAVHVVLVDYFMPRMTGEDLVREIRSFDPYIQIILLTGYSGDKPPRRMLADLDIQGYHDKADGPEKLLLWTDIALKAHSTIKALQERERLKRDLIANVSHEFRTPLNVIGGYTALIMEGEFGRLPEDAEAPLRSMAEATKNLAELVEDFLDYTKFEARPVGVTRQVVSTAEVARELARMGMLLVEGRPIEFRTDVQSAPAAILTDSVKLRTILRNLITNAAKFTAAGSITLRIAIEGNQLIFSVQDTGPGIRQEDIPTVFEPFRQLSTVSHSRSGFGLGLALSRKLALVLGGSLQAKSEVGVGSTFYLALPVSAASRLDAPAAHMDAPIHEAQPVV